MCVIGVCVLLPLEKSLDFISVWSILSNVLKHPKILWDRSVSGVGQKYTNHQEMPVESERERTDNFRRPPFLNNMGYD